MSACSRAVRASRGLGFKPPGQVTWITCSTSLEYGLRWVAGHATAYTFTETAR